MKVFVINLEKDVARKEHVLKQCQSIGFEAEVFNAIDGRLLSPQEISDKTHPELSAGLTESEIGCALSHHGVYQQMVSENIEVALILEDDVEFDHQSRDILNYLASHIPQRPTIYLLAGVRKYLKGGKKIPCSEHTLVNVSQAALSHAYIINLAAAKKLNDYLYPIWLEADRWTFMIECGLVNIKAILPVIGHLSELSHESTIWSSESDFERKAAIRELRKVTVKKIRKNRTLSTKCKIQCGVFLLGHFLKLNRNKGCQCQF